MKSNLSINDTQAVVRQFSRFATEYQKYSIIQQQVAYTLANFIPKKSYNNTVDIGCGSGILYRELCKQYIDIDNYYAIDLSEEMLKLHPSSSKIYKMQLDFNQNEFISSIPTSSIDMILSSSALQWCRDLDGLLAQIDMSDTSIYMALFSSNTFKTIHKLVNMPSPIHSLDYILEVVDKLSLYYKVKQYKLYFDNRYDMFYYIKKSGVSGGQKRLSYKQTRQLIRQYPLDYLEFEVVFISTSKTIKNI